MLQEIFRSSHGKGEEDGGNWSTAGRVVVGFTTPQQHLKCMITAMESGNPLCGRVQGVEGNK